MVGDYHARSNDLVANLNVYCSNEHPQVVAVEPETSDRLLVLLFDKYAPRIEQRHPAGRGKGRPSRLRSLAKAVSSHASRGTCRGGQPMNDGIIPDFSRPQAPLPSGRRWRGLCCSNSRQAGANPTGPQGQLDGTASRTAPIHRRGVETRPGARGRGPRSENSGAIFRAIERSGRGGTGGGLTEPAFRKAVETTVALVAHIQQEIRRVGSRRDPVSRQLLKKLGLPDTSIALDFWLPRRYKN